MNQPLVAVTSDRRMFDNYYWHATPEQYLEALVAAADVLPVIVPSLGERIDLDALLEGVDGVLVTGSRSNVHPAQYGGEVSEKNGPYDLDRDATTLPLIRKAIETGVPLLAICRGIQELNVALGGSLAGEIQEIDGRMDHRGADSEDRNERFALKHNVRIAEGSCLAAIYGAGDIKVNSVHRQSADRLGANLVVEAVAPDGTVEAVSVKDAPAFAVGVQWHPEYWVHSDDNSAKIFAAFGVAVREHRARRRAYSAAAE